MSADLWRRLRDTLTGRMRQRVTLSGLGFSCLIAVVGVLAFLTANNLLFLLLACLLGALLVSGFLSRLSLSGLELDFVFPEHVSARRQVGARMKLRNEKSWMPTFSLHVRGSPGSVYSSGLYFPVLAGGATVEETVDVFFARRGAHRENSFQLRSKFPFGFAERQVLVTLRREAVVYPCLDPQPEFERILKELIGEVEARGRGRGHDFYRIRPYETLESARHVDWKATAHTGELQVREFAREQDPLVEIFFDIAVGEDLRSWFERAVACSAFLCWEMSLRGARVRFRTVEFDVSIPVESDVYTILKYLAFVEPQRSRSVVGPGREDSVQVLVSASPEPLIAAGWDSSCVFRMDATTSPVVTGRGD